MQKALNKAEARIRKLERPQSKRTRAQDPQQDEVRQTELETLYEEEQEQNQVQDLVNYLED